jgi:CO/xanthine dehydrogenase Mo-binding subunit
MSDLDRRQFIVTSAAAGGLLVTFGLSAAAEDAPPPPATAFIRIPPKGPIVLIMPRVEMGQGVYTSQAMLLAEELEVGLDQVVLEAAPPNAALYSDPINGEQVTGTSASTMAWYDPLRHAGAITRMLLIEAAAKDWKINPGLLKAERGEVIDVFHGRRARYGGGVWHRCPPAGHDLRHGGRQPGFRRQAQERGRAQGARGQGRAPGGAPR